MLRVEAEDSSSVLFLYQDGWGLLNYKLVFTIVLNHVILLSMESIKIKTPDEVKRLHALGYSYNKITEMTGYSKGSICYHLGEGQKEKTKIRTQNRRATHPMIKKLDTFKHAKKNEYIKPINKEIEKGLRTPQQFAMRNLYLKIRSFHNGPKNNRKGIKMSELNFTKEDVMNRSNICYITGRQIDYMDPESYSLDHIISVSKGGTNDFINCGVTCKIANVAKSNYSLEELDQFIIDAARHRGLISRIVAN